MTNTMRFLCAVILLAGFASPALAVNDDGKKVHYRHSNERVGQPSIHQFAGPAFSFACTTDGGMRAECR